MKKNFLGIAAIAMIAFANLYLVSSDETMERLILLQDVESLAKDEVDREIMESEKSKELRSYLCSSGSYYEKCVDVLDSDAYCLFDWETDCGVSDEPDDNNTSPGDTEIIENECSSLGHNFTTSEMWKRCTRCGLTIRL